MRNQIVTAAMTLGIGILTAASAGRASVIYQDSFSRGTTGTPATLNGTQPDVVNTGSATWVANAATTPTTDTTDGSFAFNVASNAAFLPFTPVSGRVYRLSADLDVVATSNNWGALGFAQSNNTSGGAGTLWFQHNNNTAAWWLERGDGTTGDQRFMGPETGGGATVSASGSTGILNYAIVLDTTSALWTASFYRNNTLVDGPVSFSSNPTIQYVGFGNSGTASGGVQIDNFKLEELPEPASLGMIVIGLGTLGRSRMFRRK